MKVLGVIPARAHSTRFPGKPLAPLRGRPLLAHVWERARACRLLDRLVIATDDPAIAAAARGWGAEAVMTRADHASGTDRVAEVARLPACADFGVIANVQGDEPLLDPRALALAIAPVVAGEAPMATLAHLEPDPEAFASPHVVKVVIDPNGDAVLFSRAPTGSAPPFLRHVGLYVFARETLIAFAQLPPAPAELAEGLEQLRATAHGIRIRVVITPYASRGIDTPEDLAALERDWNLLSGGLDTKARESPR